LRGAAGVTSETAEGGSGVGGTSSETVGVASGTAVAGSGSSVFSSGVSIGCAARADFGCHFLRSGAGVLFSSVGSGDETGAD